MEKKICFAVDSDIYEKFCLALNLTNESENVAIETCMGILQNRLKRLIRNTIQRLQIGLMKAKIITEKQFSVFLYGH